jgi:hypothetical protein
VGGDPKDSYLPEASVRTHRGLRPASSSPMSMERARVSSANEDDDEPQKANSTPKTVAWTAVLGAVILGSAGLVVAAAVASAVHLTKTSRPLSWWTCKSPRCFRFGQRASELCAPRSLNAKPFSRALWPVGAKSTREVNEVGKRLRRFECVSSETRSPTSRIVRHAMRLRAHVRRLTTRSHGADLSLPTNERGWREVPFGKSSAKGEQNK